MITLVSTTSSVRGPRERVEAELVSVRADRKRFERELIGDNEEQLPLVAFRLAGKENFDEFDIAWQLSAERGWMVPAYTLPPNAQDETIMRALVKETLSRALAALEQVKAKPA